MSTKKHHIKKQLLDFQFSSKSSASKWQQDFVYKYQDEFLKVMNFVFDRYEDKNFYEIEKIELDLGVTSEAEMISKFKIELYRELEKVLKKHPPSTYENLIEPIEKKVSFKIQKEGKRVLIDTFSYFLIYGSFPWNATISSLSKLEEQLTKSFSFAEMSRRLKQRNSLKSRWGKQRLYYQFSPHFSENLFKEFFKTELINTVHIVNGFTEFFNGLNTEGFFSREEHIPIHIENDEILRWIALESQDNPAHWPVNFLSWSLGKQQVGQKVQQCFSRVRSTLKEKKLAEKSVEVIAKNLYHIFLKPGRFSAGDFSGKESEKEFEKESGRGENEKIKEQDKKWSSEKKYYDPNKDKPKDGKPDTWEERKSAGNDPDQNEKQDEKLEAQKNAKENETGNLEENNGPEPTKVGSEKEGDLLEKNNRKSDSQHDSQQRNFPASEENPATGLFEISEKKAVISSVSDFESIEDEDSLFSSLSELYVTHSGQVLIWPYLSRLFEKLQYIKQQKFTAVAQQERAVLLLGFIATGNEVCEEHQLVISKLLCGWPLQKPVKKNIELGELEKKEAELMLTNLITNWEKLKNTSIAGLRETFFWREGKLTEEDNNWKFLVEQKAVDILLDYLPYTISVLKLPWVKKRIIVDWS